MSDPLAELQRFIDEQHARAVLDAVERAHDAKVCILANPEQYEPVRQALCSVRPDMESQLRPDPCVKLGTVLLMDTSVLERTEWTFR